MPTVFKYERGTVTRIQRQRTHEMSKDLLGTRVLADSDSVVRRVAVDRERQGRGRRDEGGEGSKAGCKAHCWQIMKQNKARKKKKKTRTSEEKEERAGALAEREVESKSV